MTQIATASRSFSPVQKLQNSPVILLYHRVANLPMDPQLLCVTPDRFAEHLRALKARGRIISMRELVATIRDNIPLPNDAFVITFDDGYADNLYQALPLLEAADAAATVFVVTGDLDVEVEFWWDQLERIALVQKSLPASLTLYIDEQTYNWNDCPDHSAEREGELDVNSWNVQSTTKPTSRQLLYRELFDLLRPLPPSVRRSCIEQLNRWSGVTVGARESHRRLTKEEIGALAFNEIIEIGAHTVNHPVLGTLPGEVQFAEIVESKRTLESILGRKVSSFSYPFGARRDYSTTTVQAARRAGFSSACSNYAGVIASNTALFELPRVLVRDWSGQTLLDRIDDVRGVRRSCG